MVAAAVVGAATIGAGIYSADQAAKTGKKQAQAIQQGADQSTGLQREMYQQSRNDLNQGIQIATGYSIGGGGGGSAAPAQQAPVGTINIAGAMLTPDEHNQYVSALRSRDFGTMNRLLDGARARDAAPQAQTGQPSEQTATPGDGGILGRAGAGAIARLDPWAQAGGNAVNLLGNLSGANGADAAQNAMSGFTTSPGYQFRMDEGLKALDRTAAARGGLLSGAALKGATQYGQGVASDEFGSYWNRLASLASGGQQAATQQGNWQTGTAQAQTNALLGGTTQVGNWGQQTANSIAQTTNQTGNAQAQIAGNTSAAQTGAVNNALNNSIYLAGRQGWLS